MKVAALDATELLGFITIDAAALDAQFDILIHLEGYRFVLLKSRDGQIAAAASGELDNAVIAALSRMIKSGRLYGEFTAAIGDLPKAGSEITPYATAFSTRTYKPQLDVASLKAFFKRWDELTEKKRKHFSQTVQNAVFARAGGCCEFDGCGAPLFEHNGTYGYYGYLAHIVATGANGPRGDDPLPPAKREDPDNVLLLCDADHRLIDRIMPDEYDADRLRAMRDRSIKDRQNYSLERKRQEMRVLSIIGDIQGVTSDIERHDAFSAVRQRGYRPDSVEINSRHLGDKQGGRDTSNPNYWSNFLDVNRGAILSLSLAVRNDGEFGPVGRRIGVFPIGNMPALVLAGRILGEARPVELFHYDRTRKTWCSPTSQAPHNSSHFTYSQEGDTRPQDAVIVTLEVTANLNPDLIPADIAHLPHIRISVDRQDQNPFTAVEEMTHFAHAVQRALNFAQDGLRVTTIHLFTIAPADCIVALGMKLQARHHAKTVVYQFSKGQPCFPALIIEPSHVTSADGSCSVDLV